MCYFEFLGQKHILCNINLIACIRQMANYTDKDYFVQISLSLVCFSRYYAICMAIPTWQLNDTVLSMLQYWRHCRCVVVVDGSTVIFSIIFYLLLIFILFHILYRFQLFFVVVCVLFYWSHSLYCFVYHKKNVTQSSREIEINYHT